MMNRFFCMTSLLCPMVLLHVSVLGVYAHLESWPQTSNKAISVTTANDGSYNISVHGQPLLSSIDTFVNIEGIKYSAGNKNLLLRYKTEDEGVDPVGSWSSVKYSYLAGHTRVIASIISYADVPAIAFDLEFPDGAQKTSVGDRDDITTGFPGFQVETRLADLGYLSLGDTFVGIKGHRFGKWDPATMSIMDGLQGGPILLMNRKGQSLWVCPFDEFMSLSNRYYNTTGEYYWGVMGQVANLPKGYSHRVMVFYGDGPRDALLSWGDVMRKFYNKKPPVYDFTNDYLSYWSDNGAYYVNYYYTTDWLVQNMTYEEALLGSLEYSNKINLPYRSIQYSVWFKEGLLGGADLWIANKDLIPDGMRYMFEKTKMESTAHNRYWSADTEYAKKNGGQYEFFVEELLALPNDKTFWFDFFEASKLWGMKTLMQDWLNWQFMAMDSTTNNTHVGARWLKQMGKGAAENDMTIQYCMALSRHVLQSLEIPAVTQVRASDDYQPGDTLRWRIGISSMVAHAVGLSPFKDTFWTTSIQPGNYYNSTEPHPELLAAVSSFSAGPVGPGDMINGTDAKLLMRCCRSDGLILKPSRPALAIDAQYIQAAFNDGTGEDGELWTTFSQIDQYLFGVIFAADLENKFLLTPTSAGFGAKFPTSYVYNFNYTGLKGFSDSSPLALDQSCSMSAICVYYTSPLIQFGQHQLILLGEADKWIPMSHLRIINIQSNSEDVLLNIKGVHGEKVSIRYVLDNRLKTITCKISEAGTNTLSVINHKCS